MAATNIIDPVSGVAVDRFLDIANEDACSDHLDGYFPEVPQPSPTADDQIVGDRIENRSSENSSQEVNYEDLRNAEIAPKGPDEEGRLRELYQNSILKRRHFSKDLNLHKYTRMACAVTGAQISLITFIDSKTQYCTAETSPFQWLEDQTVPRSQSICSHTVLQPGDDVFIVSDLSKDWRFKNRAFVIGYPHMRFYAGVPLRTKNGYNIGAICILDSTVKKLVPFHINTLKDLAQMIVQQLEYVRENELLQLTARMQTSISSFTRLFLDELTTVPNSPDSIHHITPSDSRTPKLGLERSDSTPDIMSSRNKKDWLPRRPSVQSHPLQRRDSDDVMNFETVAEAIESDNSSVVSVDQPIEAKQGEGEVKATPSSNGTSPSFLDMERLYRLACSMTRETLDLEGVCFVDVCTYDEATNSVPAYMEETKNQREGSGGKKLSSFTTPKVGNVLGSSSSAGFSEFRKSQIVSPPATEPPVLHSTPSVPIADSSESVPPEFVATPSTIFTPSTVDSDLINKTPPAQVTGQLDISFIKEFMRLYPRGHIYHSDIPQELYTLLPDSARSAIVTPIYDYSNEVSSLVCAFTTRKTKRLSEEQKGYLEAFGNQLISEITKRKIMVEDHAKGVFISNVSHELRSPLHGILASVEFLNETELDTHQKNLVATIDTCGRTLLDVINHVLDFSKLTSLAKSAVRKPITTHQELASEKLPNIVGYGTTQHQALDSIRNLASLFEEMAVSCCAGLQYKSNASIDVTLLDKTKMPPVTFILDLDYSIAGWSTNYTMGALQRILMNLVGNALKYTRQGHVILKARLIERRLSGQEENDEGDATAKSLQLLVIDTGKGIDPYFLKHRLFSAFAQEDSLQVGAGLGMSIVKEIVARCDGRINVASTVGVGTIVEVLLPLASDDFDPKEQEDILQFQLLLAGRKIFVTGFDMALPKDAEFHRTLSSYVGSWFGLYISQTVEDADIILTNECEELSEYLSSLSNNNKSMFRSIYDNDKPLLILANWGQATFSTLQILKESGRYGEVCTCPIGPYKLSQFLLTCVQHIESHPTPAITFGALPVSIRATNDRHVSHLQEIIENRFSDNHMQQQSYVFPMLSPNREIQDFQLPPKSIPHQLSVTNIEPTSLAKNILLPPVSNTSYDYRGPVLLLCEDNPVNLSILVLYCQKRGVQYFKAEDGSLAVQAVQSRSSGFDIILMDIQMPVMDGIAATIAIRGIEKNRDVTEKSLIVALTGLDTESDQLSAFAAGVDMFLTKPLSMKRLDEIVNTWRQTHSVR